MNVARVIALLRDLEGWRDFVYDDRSPWPRSEVGRLDCRIEGGQYKVNATGGTATVGYGETGADFVDRYWGRRITQAEALDKMAERVPGFYQGVRRCIDADLTEHQWEAVTTRAYQTGAGGFCRSATAALLRAGDVAGALARWREEFAHPERSEVEIAHFMTPDEEITPMDGWMPDVIHTPPNNQNRAGLDWLDGTAWKLVLHTTESGYRRSQGGPVNYHGHQSYPHFEVSEEAIEQYLPITVGAYALAASTSEYGAGNAAHGVQIEIVWAAANAANMPEGLLANVARVLTFLRRQTGMTPNLPPQGFPARIDPGRYWFDRDGWYAFEGLCGHGNVPGNFDRWDPGLLPADRIVALSNAEMGDTPDPQEEDDMALPLFGDSPEGREGGLWMVFGGFRKRVHTTQVWDDWQRLGAKHIGDVIPESKGKFPVAMFDALIDIEPALTARIVVTPGENGAIDYAAVAEAVADEMYGRLAG